MSNPSFHDEISLAEQAEALGKQALRLGLIPSFAVYHFPDSWQFYIPDAQTGKPLTPEEAYLKLMQIIQTAASSGS